VGDLTLAGGGRKIPGEQKKKDLRGGPGRKDEKGISAPFLYIRRYKKGANGSVRERRKGSRSLSVESGAQRSPSRSLVPPKERKRI